MNIIVGDGRPSPPSRIPPAAWCMRLIFVGPPGSGKGTQTQLLAQRLGLSPIGTGDMLREAVRLETPAGRRAKPFVAAGQLVPDDLVNEIVAQMFRAGSAPKAFVMDGYPRTLSQAQSFDQVLEQKKLPLDAVVYLKVADEEIIRRLENRQREDDQVDIIRKRLEIFHAQNREILEYYRRRHLLVEVPGVGDVETIYALIDNALKNKLANL